MRISLKLLGFFLSIALLVGLAGQIAVFQSQQALVREIGLNSVNLAASLMDEIDRLMYSRIEFLQIYANQHALAAEAQRSSLAFSQRPDRLEHINNTDRDWKEKRDTPFIQSVLSQPLSAEFGELISYLDKRYRYPVFSEIYLTNQYGMVIASSGRTSDYLQADEAWYQQAVAEQDFWIGDVEYDESSDTFASDIVINLYDEAGIQTGIFKAVLNIKELVRVIQASEAKYATHAHPHESKLVTRDGRMIYSSEHTTPLQPILQTILSGFANNAQSKGYFLGPGDVEGEEVELFARAVSKGYLDYQGLGWSLIIEHESEAILMRVTALRNRMLVLLGIALITATLLSIVMARSLAQPFVKLCQASAAIGKGKLDTRVSIQATGEIGLLASSINKMASDLQKTTVSKTYTDKIIENMQNCLMVTTPQGRIEKVNSATLKLLGFEENELLGHPINTVFGPGKQVSFNDTCINLVMTKGSIRNIEKTFRTRDGRRIVMLFSGTVIHDAEGAATAVVCAALDISDYKRAQQELHESEQRFRRVAATIPDILYTVKLPGGETTYISPSVTSLLGFTPEEWLVDPGLRERQLHEQDREQFRTDLVATMGSQQEFVSQYRLWHKDGIALHWLEDRASLEFNRAGKAIAIHGVMTDITRRKQAEEKITHQAFHDSLTDLPNRAMILQVLDETIDLVHRRNGDAAVLFVDLDNFKLVNDTLGHAVGDELLLEAAQRLQIATRDNDVVARLGGDEFVVLLSNPGSDQTATVAQRILAGLKQPFLVGGQETYISASIGISLFPIDGKDSSQLIQHADNAMYHAKEQGRDNYQFFSWELLERQHKKMSLATMLHKAIESSEFILHYQPIIELASGKMVGVEALIRWQHEPDKLISPAEFLPVAEDTGLILPIGEWVIREACLQSRAWSNKGISLQVAINLSVRQMWHGDIVSQVLQIINETGVSRELLEFEVTESAMISDPDRMATIFNSFRENGLRIALDDFGTGYSSLDRLKRLPFNKLKIHKSFVDGIPADKDDIAIISATIQMSQSLSLQCLAEGIETAEQLRFLKQLGCDYGQGYYFSKPVTPTEIEQLIVQQHCLESDE